VDGLDALISRAEQVGERLGVETAWQWPTLVTGRAGLRNFSRQGRVSPNGSARLLAARDGWFVLNLPRPEDVAALGAVFETAIGSDYWEHIAALCADRTVGDLVGRARLLGIAAGSLSAPRARSGYSTSDLAPSLLRHNLQGLRVVDLTALWAGPLCAALLGSCGMEVIKVESSSRPDGARQDPAFYSWLHEESQEQLTFDFSSHQEREELRELLSSADVVLTSSRPRALRTLGLDPASIRMKDGATWVSITGYGAADPEAIAFGDDAAVAGGLVAWDDRGSPGFCGDAIADPISGITAAVAVLESMIEGGGVHVQLSLAASCAALLNPTSWREHRRVAQRFAQGSWFVGVNEPTYQVATPSLPTERVCGGVFHVAH